MSENSPPNSLNNQKTETIPVVFFGRLEERKGLCTFIEAIKLLEPELQNQIKITFMGKVVPLYSAELKHLNSEQYIEQELEKNLEYEIISNFYSQQAIQYISDLHCPIVCLTSPQENFPNTALEMGQLPVSLVVSDTGGFRETLQLVQRSEGLYWFKPKDADSLAEMLTKAIANYPETPTVAAKSTLEEINQKLLEEKIAYIEKAFEQVKPLEKPQAKVTVGIISQNQGQYLVDCLSSIEAQTYDQMEVIVIDDDSKDGQSKDQFLHAQSLFPDYKFIQQQTSKGIGAIRNHLLEISSGDYFLYLNSQVTLFPMAIEKFMEAASNSHAAIVTCAQKEIGAVDGIVSYQGGTLPTMMKSNVYGGECCLFSRALLDRFKHTEDKGITSQSWEIIAAAVVTGEAIVYYPYPLYEYLVTSESEQKKEASAPEKYSLRQYLAQIPPSQWTARQIYMLLTAVQQLQDLPAQMDNLQWNLQQTTEQLSQSQAHIQHLQNQLQNQSLSPQISELEQKLHQSQAQLSQSQDHLQQLESQLQEAKERIKAMETSKFWGLRKAWFKVKKTIGLPTNE
jgi:hypothetical protein